MTRPAGGSVICRPVEAEAVELADGGVLDNQPLRPAVTAARTGFVEEGASGRPRWRPAPDLAGIRLHLGHAWYPSFEGLPATWEVHPMLGLELDLPL